MTARRGESSVCPQRFAGANASLVGTPASTPDGGTVRVFAAGRGEVAEKPKAVDQKIERFATLCIWVGVTVAIPGIIGGFLLAALVVAVGAMRPHGGYGGPNPWTDTLAALVILFGPFIYGVGLIVAGLALKKLRPWTRPILVVWLGGALVYALILLNMMWEDLMVMGIPVVLLLIVLGLHVWIVSFLYAPEVAPLFDPDKPPADYKGLIRK